MLLEIVEENKMVDKTYCASSYLMYRTVVDENKTFYPDVSINRFRLDFERIPVGSSNELKNALEKQMYEWTKDGKAALALSGGIDSAILAKFMRGGGSLYLSMCSAGDRGYKRGATSGKICGRMRTQTNSRSYLLGRL